MPIRHDLQIGSLFKGRYELLSELGAGSFGRVYRARQLSTGQDVALKIVGGRDGSPGANDNRVERFRREMRLSSELFHPNIVRLIDSGDTEEGAVYAAFEYVPGMTLQQLIAEQGRLPLREAVHLMSQVLDALSCAHGRGVVHRDLKPENIMVTQTGARRNAMVLDFGLGGFAADAHGWGLPRITHSQEMMGTPCYAAPEQLRGEAPTTRSDLYSWGLIFIEALTGELAVRGASVQEAVLRQLNDEPIAVPADISDERLRKLLATVTAKPVEKRDVTVGALLRVLSAVGSREPLEEIDPGEPARSPGERRQVTILSCRAVVSGRGGERLDLEQLDELTHAQAALYAELAARRGGRLATAFGDRGIIVFGYPRAREDDARRAARTALNIAAEVRRRSTQWAAHRNAHIDVHIGVHTGLVIARELRGAAPTGAFDLVGPTPCVATRLEGMAAGGEVLASLDTHRLLRGEIESEPAGQCDLPEIGGKLPVFRLTGVRQSMPGMETIQSQRETQLVGRTRQLEQLSELWTRTQAGRGTMVLVSGEPGIGKSRLLRELRRRVPADAWLALQCAAENQNSPLRPVVELLASWDEPIDAVLARHGIDSPDTLALLAQLLNLPVDDRWPALRLTPERQKELTLNALVTLFLRIGAERPTVLAFEDLHWADPTTLELLGLMAADLHAPDATGSGEAPRLCIALTARPQFAPSWPIGELSLIPLPHLAGGEVEEMVRASRSGDPASFSQKVIDEVILRSDGIPLFVEEVSRVLAEPVTASIGHPGELEIPGSLRDLFAARLDGVSSSARETAQIASVLGRDFRYELLRAVSNKPESVVRADIRELATASLLYQRRSARTEVYFFKHALLRDTAYESMVRATCQPLHVRVANTLRERFPDVERTQPEVLALHFERGGQLEQALAYWSKAGNLAMKRGAYVESICHLEAGLALLERLPTSLAAIERELELRTALNVGLIATNGYGAERVERNCSRAQDLCVQLGDAPQLIPALYGLWTYHLLRDHRRAPLELAERIQQIARSPEHVLIATATRGITAYFMGELSTAMDYLERATALYEIGHQRALARGFGEDAALLAPLYRIWCLFHLGRLDEARAHQQRVETLVAKVATPYLTATSMVFAMLLGLSLEDIDMTRAYADAVIALAMEQRFPFFLSTGTCGRGWTKIAEGDVASGIADITQGLEVLKLTGAVVARSYWLACIAEGHLRIGDAAAGLATVDEGLALSEGNLNRLQDPWLHRLRGELLLLTGDTAAAEQFLRTAATLARTVGDKPFELRAVTSLARLLRSQGKSMAARPLLAEVYGSFSEGLEARDLRAARTLLDDAAS